MDLNPRPPEAYERSGRGGSRYDAEVAKDADNPEINFERALQWQCKAYLY
jgi:hypothetical protein